MTFVPKDVKPGDLLAEEHTHDQYHYLVTEVLGATNKTLIAKHLCLYDLVPGEGHFDARLYTHYQCE